MLIYKVYVDRGIDASWIPHKSCDLCGLLGSNA